SNNGTNLDLQNGGFTVFGQISSTDMAVVEAIAALPRYNFTGITDLPLVNYSNTDRDDNKPLVSDNLVTIESVVIVDARVDTIAGITQVPTTALQSSEESSGGSAGWWSLLLSAIAYRRKK
ncbi:MAG TPA: GlyGly-CTERM sorting domain-containing protein, partial [Rheinheimera sp.]|nr:GlyGly-CTERM sorting domain-containing protein [Rheinheimera sp.]